MNSQKENKARLNSLAVNFMRQKKIYKIVALFIILFAVSFVGYQSYKTYKLYFDTSSTYSLMKADLSDISDKTLSHYYVDMDGQGVKAVESGIYSIPPFDENGIPIVTYKAITGKHYNPATIAQFAIENWEIFLRTNNKSVYDVFIKQANWLVDNQVQGGWYYHFDLEDRSLKKPWLSGLAQGQGISVLLRAYQRTNDVKYLKAATDAFEVMMTPLDKGGILYRDNTGLWFEEYPNQLAPSHVMNGHIWALFGVWDLYRVTGDKRARDAFDDGVIGLKKDINKYDTGYWVLYEQRPKSIPINAIYINFEIEQLQVLHALTNDSIFSDYAAKWKGYQHINANSFLNLLWHIMITERAEGWRKRINRFVGM